MKHQLTGFASRLKRIDPACWLWLGIAVFIFYFLAVSFFRHMNFYSLRLDLGNMDQTVWNVLHGNGFTLTDPMGTQQLSRLAVHADFLLIFMAPFYLLWQDPRMLLLLQTVIVGLGALPLFWIAEDRLKNRYLALGISYAYLLYPPLERMMFHDFHAVAFAMTFLLFAFWYLTKNKPLNFLVFCVLAGLTKEQMWVTVGLLSLYMAYRNHRWLFGLIMAAVSFSLFYYLFWIAIPAAAPSGHHFALSYLSDYGDRENAILKNILVHPWQVVATAFKADRLFYYFQLLLPVAFLPLAAPFFLIFASPGLLINVLSNNNLMRMIDYQYTSDITPFLFVAAVEGVRRILPTLKKRKERAMLFSGIGLCVLAASVAWGEMPYGINSRIRYFLTPIAEKGVMQQVARQIDPMYTVSATNNIGAHLSERKYLYNFPIHATDADYVVVALGDQYAWPSGDAQKQAVDELLASPDYALLVKEGNFYAFKRLKL